MFKATSLSLQTLPRNTYIDFAVIVNDVIVCNNVNMLYAHIFTEVHWMELIHNCITALHYRCMFY